MFDLSPRETCRGRGSVLAGDAAMGSRSLDLSEVAIVPGPAWCLSQGTTLSVKFLKPEPVNSWRGPSAQENFLEIGTLI